MASNNIPIETVSVLDPRFSYNEEVKFTTLRGPQAWTTTQTVAPQPIANTVNFNVITNNRETAISRKALINSTWTYTIRGTNTSGGPLVLPGYVAPRQYPFHSATNNMSHIIGQAPASAQTYNSYVNQIYGWYKQDLTDVYNTELSQCPSFPDQSFDYGSITNSLRNPLGTYEDSSFDSTARGGFSGWTIIDQSDNAVVATCTLNSTEELMISPFCWGAGSNECPCFIGIEQMTLIFSMDLSRGLSIVKDQGQPGLININSVTSQINSATLILQQFSPETSIPKPLDYILPYSSVTRYQTQGPTVVPGQKNISIVSNNIQFNSIPRLVFVYASRPDGSRDSTMTDAVFPIANANSLSNNFNFLFDNRANLQTATAYDLYLMSVRNGLKMSWTQFSSQLGSVICVDLGAGDIGFQNWQTPSLTGNYNVQITCAFDNPFTDASIAMVLNVFAVYDGAFNTKNNVTTVMPSILTAEDVVNAKENSSLQAYESSVAVSGGSILSGLATAAGVARSVYCNPTARKLLCGSSVVQSNRLRGGAMSGGCSTCMGAGCMGCNMGMGKRKMRGGKVMSKRNLSSRLM